MSLSDFNQKNVLALLRSKNRCIERILAAASHFLGTHSPTENTSLDMEKLKLLEAEREASFKGMRLYDLKLSEAIQQLSHSERTPEMIERVRSLHSATEQLIVQIMKADQQIIEKIEKEKAQTMNDLRTQRKQRDVLGKFKSTWMGSSGEELDEKL